MQVSHRRWVVDGGRWMFGRPVDHLKRPTEEARRGVAGRTDLPRKLRKRVVTIAERPNDRPSGASISTVGGRFGRIWSAADKTVPDFLHVNHRAGWMTPTNREGS